MNIYTGSYMTIDYSIEGIYDITDTSITLHFYYTLSGEADTVGVMNQIDAKTLLLSELKNTTAMLAYKDAGYNFAYTYHSQKNPQVVIFQTVFSEKDYKAEAPAQKD